ncbi:hypothetical protein AURDEDRAFT_153146 [Auricularia subglabra TFB-10046 SS5]|nr:hypothetical protein AURDEDRAFT_153146 [Auricularia subglabra TFB-10046 SS5]
MPHKVTGPQERPVSLAARRKSVVNGGGKLKLSILGCLPLEIIRHIMALTRPTISDVSALGLVSRSWLVAARSILFKELTVLPDRAKDFVRIVRHAPHILPYVRELRIWDDVKGTRILRATQLERAGNQLRGVATLWLTNVFYSGGLCEVALLLDELVALRELRMQNVHVPPSASYAQAPVTLARRARKIAVRFVGHNSEELYMLFSEAGSRVHELSLHSPTAYAESARLDALVDCLCRHAKTIDTVSIHLPLMFACDATGDPLPVPLDALVRALRKCPSLRTLKLSFDDVRPCNLQDALLPILWSTLTNVRRLRITGTVCPGGRQGPHIWTHEIVRRADSALASWVGLRSVAVVLPCRVCAATCAERFRLLVIRGVLTV